MIPCVLASLIAPAHADVFTFSFTAESAEGYDSVVEGTFGWDTAVANATPYFDALGVANYRGAAFMDATVTGGPHDGADFLIRADVGLTDNRLGRDTLTWRAPSGITFMSLGSGTDAWDGLALPEDLDLDVFSDRRLFLEYRDIDIPRPPNGDDQQLRYTVTSIELVSVEPSVVEPYLYVFDDPALSGTLDLVPAAAMPYASGLSSVISPNAAAWSWDDGATSYAWALDDITPSPGGGWWFAGTQDTADNWLTAWYRVNSGQTSRATFVSPEGARLSFEASSWDPSRTWRQIVAEVTAPDGTSLSGPVSYAIVSAEPVVDPAARVANSSTVGAGTQIGADAVVRERVALGSLVEVGERTTIGHDASVGDGTAIGEDSTLRDRVEVGSHVEIGARVVLGHDASVGDGTVLGDGTRLRDRVEIGAGVQIGSGVVLGHDVVIEDGAVLGDAVRVRDRVRIGAGAVIGAGEVIPTGTDVPSGAVLP